MRSGAIWCHCHHFSKVNWKRQDASDYESISVSSLFAKEADKSFSQNVWELLKFSPSCLCGAQVERSISCIWRIHIWLHNTMTSERPSDLAVIAMCANAVTILRSIVCQKFVTLHPRRKTASTLLAARVIRYFLSASASFFFVTSRVCCSLQSVLPKFPNFGQNIT